MVEIKAVKKRTGKEFLEEIRKKYGSIDKLRRYVRQNPSDFEAEFDLLDAEYLLKNPKEQKKSATTGTSYVSWNTQDITKLTSERLKLLSRIKHRRVKSIKELAKDTGRDYKNVFNDLQILEKLGLIRVSESKNAKIPRFDFEKVEIYF